MRKTLLAFTLALSLASLRAQTPAAPPAAAAPAAAVPAAIPLTDADLKGIPTPKAEDRAKGDPDGGLTGNVSDVAVADPITDKTPKAKGLTLGDLANQAGQNKIAINFVWTLIAAFLVMFMQAGFALVETGLCRAKNANHTMMMNLMVYATGVLAFWVCATMRPKTPFTCLGSAMYCGSSWSKKGVWRGRARSFSGSREHAGTRATRRKRFSV